MVQIRSLSGGPRSRRGEASQAWSSHWHCHPGRTAGDGLRALSPRARVRRCAGFGRLCLHSQPTALANGRFDGTLECKLPTDNSGRTAEIGGRSRQAQDDHQGRVGIQLACGSQLQEVLLLACSLHAAAGRLRKAVAERHGEKVCREDDLREVAKSAVRGNTHRAAMLSVATQTGNATRCTGRRVTRRAAEATPAQRDTLLAESYDHVPVDTRMRGLACLRTHARASVHI